MIYNYFDIQKHVLPYLEGWQGDLAFPCTPTYIIDNDEGVIEFIWEWGHEASIYLCLCDERGPRLVSFQWLSSTSREYPLSQTHKWLGTFRENLIRWGPPGKPERTLDWFRVTKAL